MRPFFLLVLLAPPALAATEEEWEAHRDAVEAACLALVADWRGQPSIEVNPWGSESYGAAILTLHSEGETDRVVCVFDKASGRAEVTAPWTTFPESE